MGIYAEYLELNGFDAILRERKKQLSRIAAARSNRDILVIASDLAVGRSAGPAPIGILYEDILPIRDQLDNLHGDKIDVILETPGGSAEITEDIVSLLRNKYNDLAFIIPGSAKSAGTIMAMAGDEILMDEASALGPIDAQIGYPGGKVFSADAFLEGLDKIKKEVEATGQLNKAYIPILQGINPGEIQRCENTQNFSKILVSRWLLAYKFRHWNRHSSTGKPVTDDEKKTVAERIAAKLCDHGHWKTHGRSLKIRDMREMGLRITNFTDNPELQDAIKRYYTLMRMTFETTSIYKLFETPTSQIYRFIQMPVPSRPQTPQGKPAAIALDFQCPKCNNTARLQANLGATRPLQNDALPFPENNLFKCPSCAAEVNISNIRNQIEAQAKQKIVK